ncbi:MAG: S8 family serine peptidase, partial [Chloroflexi bacterium]|nr:S8 family serine peptidase [Chloroflexota bacterium]
IFIFTLAPAPADTAVAANVQPALLAMAAEQPDAQTRVIIQKSDVEADVAGLVASMGGTVVHDLRLINAVAAEMTLETAVDLSFNANVSWVSLDGAVESAGKPPKDDGPTTVNTYLDTLGVRDAWALGYDGQGIGIALIDSGIEHADLNDHVVVEVPFNIHSNIEDYSGHGTHVAGVIAGSGDGSRGDYAGVAPGASLIALSVGDYNGNAYESDTVAALQWIYDNKDAYNIRIVNLSINSTTTGFYHESPLNAAAEILWFNGIVVVVSAGNSGTDAQIDTITAAPANDPFFIAVGATDENGTDRRQNDTIPTFSASGWTLDGHWKPDIFAPGVDIISALATGSMWDYLYTEREITTSVQGQEYGYFRASGTSMSAPMVSGAVALLLQAEPNLTPDQVKYRLNWAATSINGYAYMDVANTLTSSTSESANQDTVPHMLLAKMALIAYWANENGDENIDWSTVDWDAVNWDAVDWDAVDWASVNWGSVNWGSVNWGSVNWGSVNWGSVNWGSVNWGSVNWGSVNWGSVNWGSVNWGSVSWDE